MNSISIVKSINLITLWKVSLKRLELFLAKNMSSRSQILKEQIKIKFLNLVNFSARRVQF